MTRKIAFVVQRYGAEVVGGAESLARQLAQRFVADLNWEVEVLTTTAVDYLTWENAYPAGESTLAGVNVRRFDSTFGRSRYFGLIHRITRVIWPKISPIGLFKPFTLFIEWLWLMAQGPVCPKMIHYLKMNAGRYDQVFFFTYLYYPTLWGYKVALPKGAVVTTAHDELAFHFHTVKRMLNAVPHVITLNPEESLLVRSKLTGSHAKVRLAGLGIDIPHALAPTSAPQNRVALYLGRISTGKGVGLLIDWMDRGFKHVTLQLAGKVEKDLTLPDTAQIDYRGFVSEEEKARLIDQAAVLINPSEHESLSLIVLEAMARQRPVLVNGKCAVMDHYAKETATVFSFRDREQFNEALNHVLQTDWQIPERRTELAATAAWVRQHYSWPAVFETYRSIVDSAASR